MNKNLFKSLKHGNFRMYFIAQIISVTGSWLQMTAMPWLIYSMTHSVLLLGTVSFLAQVPILIISPFAGVAADHYNKRKILIISQTILTLQALLLAWLTISGKIQIYHIFILAILMGIASSFDMPARQAFIIDLVGKEDLMNAIALNSFIINSTRMIGPAVAGILVASFSEGLCFLINGISFIPVIIILFIIKTAVINKSDRTISISQKFMSGINYIKNSKDISSLILLISATSAIISFPMILMPVFVKDVFKLDVKFLGILMSASGVGTLMGAIRIASNKSSKYLKNIVIYSAMGFGMSMIAFSFSKNIYLTILFMAFIGYFMVSQLVATNTMIQLLVSDDMRGRVMGFYTMAFMGIAPIGSLAAGVIAHKLSAPAAVAIAGVICLSLSLILRKKILSINA